MSDPLLSLLTDTTTPWQAAERLMRAWLDGGEVVSPLNRDDTRESAEHLADWVDDRLRRLPVSQFEPASLSDPPDLGLSYLHMCHSVAMGVDRACSTTFSSSWLAEHEPVFELGVGDLFPVGDMRLMGGAGYSTRPFRLGLPANELPHLRQHTNAGVDVVFDASHSALIDNLMGDVPLAIAAIVPNDDESELAMPAGLFPIGANDVAEQVVRLRSGVAGVLAVGQGVIVIPELAAPRSCIDELMAELGGSEGGWIVFAGSEHHEAAGVRVNEGPVLLPDVGVAWVLTKAEPFETRDGAREGITAGRRPRLVIACGQHVRVAGLICKDFLVPGNSELLGHLGVHLVGVPAMSQGLGDFGTAAHALITRSQGAVVVANNPLRWDGAPVSHALLSHPIGGVDRVTAAIAPSAPGFSHGHLGRGWQGFTPIAPGSSDAST